MKKLLFVLSMFLFSSVLVNAQEVKEDNPNAPQIKFENYYMIMARF